MTNGLIETAAQARPLDERRIYGVAVAQVVNNLDTNRLGRVQIRLPWLPGIEPWARVAVLMAGMNRGTFFIPQIGDEVLVAFNHGDIREPYVIGSLWNGQDQPPAAAPTDPITKRLIRTPIGHEIAFDEIAQSITITNSTQQKITIGLSDIEISTAGGTARATFDLTGAVSITAATSIELKAPQISIQGGTIDLKSSVSTSINGGLACNVEAALVKIN